MIKRIMYSINFLKALKYDEKEQYEKVIKTLEKEQKFINIHKNMFPDYYILYGEAFTRLFKFEEGEKQFLFALSLLKKQTDFNKEEITHLTKYIYKWLIHIYEQKSDFAQKNNYAKRYETIIYNKANIRESLKINFKI